MGIRFLEKNINKASLIFLPRDTFDGNSVIYEKVEVYLAGAKRPPIRHPEGYIIYMDLPDGVYHVTAGGKYYNLYETFDADTTTFDPLDQIIDVFMKPRPDYPFPDNATLLRGVVDDGNGVLLEGAKIEVVSPADMAYTDASGAFVFFFNPAASTMDIQIRVSAPGYLDQLHSLTVVQYDTVTFSTSLVLETGPDIAFISGTVRSAAGDPISQARVVVEGTQISNLTSASGTIMLAVPLVQTTETVSLLISQDGYSDRTVSVDATKQQTAFFDAVLSTNILPNTAGLQVDVTNGPTPLEGALVQVPQKNRSSFTNADGRVTFYFNHLVDTSERVDIVVSQTGFVTKSESVLLRESKFEKVRISILPDMGA